MEEKILEIFKLANELDEKQDKVYAKVEYSADKTRRLEISIISKDNYSYIESCSIMLLNNQISRLEAVIEIFKEYIGGTVNE